MQVRVLHFFILVCLNSTLYYSFSACAEKLTLVAGSTPNKKLVKEATLIADIAFARMGLQLEIEQFPHNRALSSSRKNQNDGQLMRVLSLNENGDFDNVVPVKTSLVSSNIYAFSLPNKSPIHSWQDFQKESIIFYPSGIKIIEQKLAANAAVGTLKGFFMEPSANNVAKLLQTKMADYVVMPIQDTCNENYIQLKQYVHTPPIRVDLYIWLNKKHAHLIPKMEAIIAEVKNDSAILQKVKALYACR